MTGSATVTAKTGPGKTVTAGVFTGLTGINFDLAAGVLFLTNGNNQIEQFELTGAETLTMTASGGLYTLTVA